ncbi:TIR domain-containing protein [Lactiplantibacillus plantarum]|nr:TIR domain-containing protein [Lactiplantibacillus plantarum]MCT3274718.1 TIR domain-containing protein [Lactiplantibacillus plantarum]
MDCVVTPLKTLMGFSVHLNVQFKFYNLPFEKKTHKDGYVGYMTDIKFSKKEIKIHFKKDHLIKTELLSDLRDQLHIDYEETWDSELERTHWAIKQVNLLKTLVKHDQVLTELLYRPKVFLSWSKKRSKKIAEKFKMLLCSVLKLQNEEVFISSKDIEYGEDWWKAISRNIENSKVGIIFVTKENFTSPWINYETGLLQDQLKNSGQVFLVSTEADFNSIDPSSPLRKFQFTKDICAPEDAYSLINVISERLDLDQDDFNIKLKDFTDTEEWHIFYRSFISEKDELFINFKEMLKFWIPKVSEAWKSNNVKGGFQFSEILPKSKMLDSSQWNADKAMVGDRDFNSKFLDLNSNIQIAIRFDQNGRLSNPYDSCITWVPGNPEQSWFLKIIYHAGKNAKPATLEVKYLNTANCGNDDGNEFKMYMKKYEQGRSFLITSLELDKSGVNNNVKNLYNSFVGMINDSQQKIRN